ncbi:hypothetical protein RFI_33427, partial [Reticulomyxa filosa]
MNTICEWCGLAVETGKGQWRPKKKESNMVMFDHEKLEKSMEKGDKLLPSLKGKDIGGDVHLQGTATSADASASASAGAEVATSTTVNNITGATTTAKALGPQGNGVQGQIVHNRQGEPTIQDIKEASKHVHMIR